MSTHTAVVRIPNPDDPESVAHAAAHASLSLLVKVSAESRRTVTIKTVTITEPEGLTLGSDLASLLSASAVPGKAVVVVAEAQDPPATASETSA